MTCVNIFCTLVLIVLVGGSISIIFVPVGKLLSISQEQCYIDNVIIPTTNPYVNSDNWYECRCGRGCSYYQPCVKFYSNLSNEILILESVYGYNNPCTYYSDDNCDNTISIDTLLSDSLNKYNNYINQSVPCYYGDYLDQGIFLENELKVGPVIIISILCGVALICLICQNCIINDNSKFCNELCCNLCDKIKTYLDKKENIPNTNTITNPVFEVVIDIPQIKLSKEEKNETCVICLNKLKGNAVKLSCGHILHKRCWNQWKKQQMICPTCRTKQ